MKMLRELTRLDGRFFIDDFELRRRGPTYTYETINRFRKRFPRAEIFFVLGSDSLADVPRWKKGAELLEMCRFAVAVRPAAGPARLLAGAVKLKVRPPAVSSTAIRRRAPFTGGFLSANVPPRVAGIIVENDLYVDAAVAVYLKKRLDNAKYRHTLGVASVAAALAVKHGADPRRARLAALIHDLGRVIPVAAYSPYFGRARIAGMPSKETAAVNPFLLHSFVSAILAQKIFGIKDKAVLNAAARHTLGCPSKSSTVYDDIIYVADAVAPDRRFPGIDAIRRAAFGNLDRAVFLCASMKLGYVLKKRKYLAPEGVAVYNSRLKQIKK
jgi:nicotinate-nucleotide adenylyltransferase